MDMKKALVKENMKAARQAVIKDVRKNQFNDGKLDLVLDIGVVRGVSEREAALLCEAYGDSNIELTWMGQIISVSAEPYLHKQFGQQHRWVLAPQKVTEEKIA